MSWWTSFRDSFVKFDTLGIVDPKKNRKMEQEQRQLINDQISAYKEQTNLAREQLDETRAQTEAEKRRVQEKQIRSLRRTYRAQGVGMLGQGESAAQDMNAKLGG